MRPAIRPSIEIKEIRDDGQTLYELRDTLRVSDAILRLPDLFWAIAQFFDGSTDAAGVVALFERHYRIKIGVEHVEGLARLLDDARFLRGGKADAAIDAWRKESIRKPACAGPNGSYPDDPAELRPFLDAHYVREGGPGSPPDRSSRARPVRALLSPHIDFRRGGHAYAHAWKAVAESCEADIFVVFGTAHGGTDPARFALTRKSYETPLGTIETDQELLERLVRHYRGPDDLFASEIAHKGEHSVEFQMIELAHLYGPGSPEPRRIKALPVLCGSIHDLLGARASADARVRAFHEALAKALEDLEPERVCFVGGVDLMHVGADFGDPFRLTEKKLESYLAKDRRTLEVVAGGRDADRFHADLSEDETRKICGHAPIHALLVALERSERAHAGEVLCHDRWYDGRSSVSFCSVAFRDAKRRP